MKKTIHSTFSQLCLLLTLSACTGSSPPAQANTGHHLSFLSHFTIPRESLNGLTISGLSDLAWDEDEQLLYAISDRGILFHFKMQISNEQIAAIKPVFAKVLTDDKAKPLRHRDAEGLVVLNANNGRKGDSQLVVALEGIPRLLRTNTAGRLINELPLHPDLRDRRAYRSGNTSLESLIRHPKYGFLTAPERSLKNQPNNLHTLYSNRKKWSFMAYPAPNSSITALELLPDNSLLVLERAWNGVGNPMVISLRRVNLAACSREGACRAENLRVMSSLFSVDNFEGLTHIKGNLYLMVSDDGQSDWLRNRLTLFRVD